MIGHVVDVRHGKSATTAPFMTAILIQPVQMHWHTPLLSNLVTRWKLSVSRKDTGGQQIQAAIYSRASIRQRVLEGKQGRKRFVTTGTWDHVSNEMGTSTVLSYYDHAFVLPAQLPRALDAQNACGQAGITGVNWSSPQYLTSCLSIVLLSAAFPRRVDVHRNFLTRALTVLATNKYNTESTLSGSSPPRFEPRPLASSDDS